MQLKAKINDENTSKILKNGKIYTERDEGCLEAMYITYIYSYGVLNGRLKLHDSNHSSFHKQNFQDQLPCQTVL